jgi:hypothetical protein
VYQCLLPLPSNASRLDGHGAGSLSPRARAPIVMRRDENQARGEALEMASRCLRIHV